MARSASSSLLYLYKVAAIWGAALQGRGRCLSQHRDDQFNEVSQTPLYFSFVSKGLYCALMPCDESSLHCMQSNSAGAGCGRRYTRAAQIQMAPDTVQTQPTGVTLAMLHINGSSSVLDSSSVILTACDLCK